MATLFSWARVEGRFAILRALYSVVVMTQDPALIVNVNKEHRKAAYSLCTIEIISPAPNLNNGRVNFSCKV